VQGLCRCVVCVDGRLEGFRDRRCDFAIGDSIGDGTVAMIGGVSAAGEHSSNLSKRSSYAPR
jgi:hypothetical protein